MKKTRTKVGVVLILCLLYLSTNTSFTAQLNLVIAPISGYFQVPVQWVSDGSLWFRDRQELQQQHQQLTKLLYQQQARLQALAAMHEENSQLRALLHLPPLQGYDWVAARIQSHSGQRQSQYLIVEATALHLNDMVVSKDGLVGLVEEVRGNYGTVRTLLDGSLAIPVTTVDHRLTALLRGQADRIQAEFIVWKDRPKAGDIFYTSGVGGLFPAGIAVAKVEKVEKIAGSQFAQIRVRALARWQGNAWLAVARKKTP
ncbi:MAG: rod shape-determining protein MreC [Mariprofundaceae bacterium]|nr:rod shape-determining protein MreC [Mariprofundaceae bacterium]